MNTENKIELHEQEILDTALQESDQLLVRSLQDDQIRRRRKIWLSVLLLGVVVMSTVFWGFIVGWFALTNAVGEKEGGSLASTLEQTEQAEKLAASGWELWKNRKYMQAAEKFEAAIVIDTKATDAWNGLGWARFNGGESEKAVAAFEKCVALEPRHPAALNGLGQIYLSWKQYTDAEKYLLLASSNAPASWYGLARMYLLQEKFDEAKKWVEKISNQGQVDSRMQLMSEAVAKRTLSDELRKMIEPVGKPKEGSIDAAKGWQMFQQGKMSTAERFFKRALTEDADNLSALNGLAFCLLNQGKHEQAKPMFEKYLKKQKDAPGPMNGLARCLKAEGKTDKAIAIWEQMVEKHPGPSAATVGLAMTYLERKEYDKSIKYFKILVRDNPENKQYQNGLKRAKAGITKTT